jgi:tRNA uridine 5-carbamoylmethylation protein Kti12
MRGLPGSGKTTFAKKLAKKAKARELRVMPLFCDVGVSQFDEVHHISLDRHLKHYDEIGQREIAKAFQLCWEDYVKYVDITYYSGDPFSTYGRDILIIIDHPNILTSEYIDYIQYLKFHNVEYHVKIYQMQTPVDICIQRRENSWPTPQKIVTPEKIRRMNECMDGNLAMYEFEKIKGY